MDERVEAIRNFWDHHARRDALWSILSDPAKTEGKWRLNEFMATGRREIGLLWHELSTLGLLREFRSALDFGCGVGRLTQALAARCGNVLGVDISEEMVAMASQVNQFENATYLSTATTGGALPEDAQFDLIYSNIVLQHVEPDLAEAYIRQFCRLLTKDGLAVFQLPSTRAEERASACRPMADRAYAGRITLLTPPPTHLGPGETCALSLECLNASGEVWDQTTVGAIRVGNHWLASDESMIVQDDGRSDLPSRVSPGEAARCVVDVTAPSIQGRVILECDLVHEGITWFGDRGSSTLRISVVVGELSESVPQTAETREYDDVSFVAVRKRFDSQSASSHDDEAAIAFPMHGIPIDRVHDIVRSEGRRVLHFTEDGRARPEWVAYRYFVS